MERDTGRRVRQSVTLVDVVAALTSIITGYHQRISKLEEEKYDREMEVARKELEVRPDNRSSTQ